MTVMDTARWLRVLAAAKDNKIGIVGIAPGARLWALRVARPDGIIMDSALLCGLDWVIEHAHKIEVVNIASPSSSAWTRLRTTLPVWREAEVPNTRGDLQADPQRRDRGRGGWQCQRGHRDGRPGRVSRGDRGLGHGRLRRTAGRARGDPERCLPETLDDHFAFFSNYGAPVYIAAPGVCVTSTFIGSQYAYSDGTSFAAPFVAGVTPPDISTHPDATPAEVREALVARAEPGPIPGDPDNSPEGLLNVRGL